MHFSLRFPESRDLVQGRFWILPLIYLVPAVSTIGGALYAAGLSPEFFTWVQRLRNLFVPVMLVLVFAKHAIDFRRIKTQQERNRLKLPLLAYWLSFAPYLLLYLLPLLIQDAPLIPFGLAVFTFFFLPLAYYAGILRYKLFKVDQIISLTIAYFATIITLSIVYSLLFAAIKRWVFGDVALSKEIFLIFLILVNLVFHPVILKLDQLIRKLFFKNDEISVKVIHEFSSRIAATLDLGVIVQAITRDLPARAAIDRCAVMILEQRKSRLYPEHLRFGGGPGRTAAWLGC